MKLFLSYDILNQRLCLHPHILNHCNDPRHGSHLIWFSMFIFLISDVFVNKWFTKVIFEVKIYGYIYNHNFSTYCMICNNIMILFTKFVSSVNTVIRLQSKTIQPSCYEKSFPIGQAGFHIHHGTLTLLLRELEIILRQTSALILLSTLT